MSYVVNFQMATQRSTQSSPERRPRPQQSRGHGVNLNINEDTGITMSGRGALKSYAKRTIPSPDLPPSVLFSYSNETVTIFDLFPKVGMHFHSNLHSV